MGGALDGPWQIVLVNYFLPRYREDTVLLRLSRIGWNVLAAHTKGHFVEVVK